MSSARLIIDPPASGAWNMAVDEALLRSAAQRGTATLRFYQWSEPTLSLGYFQAADDRQQHFASLACPLVRRASGGGAIVHDRELTYSLAMPLSNTRTAQATRLYEGIDRISPDLG
jgi:lipoate-protein ligase A